MSRIGYGKGYYDRFLTSYHNQPHRTKGQRPLLGLAFSTELHCSLYLLTFLVALGFDEQVVDAGEVPTEDHDWKMDAIVTSQGFIWPSPEASR